MEEKRGQEGGRATAWASFARTGETAGGTDRSISIERNIIHGLCPNRFS